MAQTAMSPGKTYGLAWAHRRAVAAAIAVAIALGLVPVPDGSAGPTRHILLPRPRPIAY